MCLNCAEGVAILIVTSRHNVCPPPNTGSIAPGRTQDISNRRVYFVVGDELKPGVGLDLTITLPVEITGGGELSIYIAGLQESSARRRSFRSQHREIWYRFRNWRLRNCS